MLGTDQTVKILEGEVLSSSEAGCMDLLPLTSSSQWQPNRPLTHPDPCFITHLIATAAHAPQTCNLRRASPADAHTAYGAAPGERRGVARRTRQII